MSSPVVSTLRQLIHELRRVSPQNSLKDNLMLRYILNQYRKFQINDQQLCKAREEVAYTASTYLCYLQSRRKHQEIYDQFHGKGERSVAETARMVGFKLPHEPK